MKAQVVVGAVAAVVGLVILAVLLVVGVANFTDVIVIASWLIAATTAWVTWRVVGGGLATDRGPSELDQVAQGPAPGAPERPVLLAELDALIGDRGIRAGDVHFSLRPILREVAAAATGSDDFGPSNPLATRCDPKLWDLLRDDRPAPDDRAAWTLRASDLPPMLSQLEEMFEWR